MKKKKVIIALTTAVTAALIAGTSVTLAWYGTGDRAYLQTIDLGVDCSREFKITTENGFDHLSDHLSREDFEDGNDYFVPVTSAYSSSWITSGVSKPVFYGQYTRSFDESGRPVCLAADGGFFSQEIYFYLDYNMTVTLDSERTTVVANESVNRETAKTLQEKYPDKTEEEIFENLNKIPDSLRFSILDYSNTESPYTIIDPRKDGTSTVFGGRLDNDGEDGYYDYRIMPDGERYEILYGDYEVIDEIPYLPAVEHDTELVGEPSCFNARTRAGVHPIDVANLDKHVKFAKESALSLSEADGTLENNKCPNYVNINLRAHELKKVVLSFYVEGWDLDNTEVTANASFSLNMAFKLNRETL